MSKMALCASALRGPANFNFQSLPQEMQLSLWEAFFQPPQGVGQKRTLNITGYGTRDKKKMDHYSCKNGYRYAVEEPLVNSSGKNIRLVCFQANETYKRALRRRTRDLNPAYIVYSYRRIRGRMRDFWLPVDPEQDMFFFHSNFVRSQVSNLREMHSGSPSPQWDSLYWAGRSQPLRPAHVMLDVRSILRIAQECLQTHPTYATLGSAPDFMIALNCCVPARVWRLSVAAWKAKFAALQIRPEKITVLVYTRLCDLFGDYEYADMLRVPYPPPSVEVVRQLGLTGASKDQLNLALRLWPGIVRNATAKGLQFPALEFACTRR